MSLNLSGLSTFPTHPLDYNYVPCTRPSSPQTTTPLHENKIFCEDTTLNEKIQRLTLSQIQLLNDKHQIIEWPSSHKELTHQELLSLQIPTLTHGPLKFLTEPFLLCEDGEIEHTACGASGRLFFNQEHQLGMKVKIQRREIETFEECLQEGLLGLKINSLKTESLLKTIEVSYVDRRQENLSSLVFILLPKINHPDLFNAIIPPFISSSYNTFDDFSVLDRISILTDVAQALDVLQSRNLTHRDLKPENIFAIKESPTQRARGKLFDYGSVCEDVSFDHFQGSLRYVAPESSLIILQTILSEADPFHRTLSNTTIMSMFKQTSKIDIYAFGLILDQVMTPSFNVLNDPKDNLKNVKERLFKPITVIPALYASFTPNAKTAKKIAWIVNHCCFLYPESRLNTQELSFHMNELLSMFLSHS